MTADTPEGFGAVSRDGLILLAGRALRNLAFGAISVEIALYLSRQGLRAEEIGLVFTIAYASSAVSAVLAAPVADRIGRRRTLALGGLLMAVSGGVLLMAAGRPIFFLAALFGTLSPTGQDVGPFQTLEQSALPSTTSPRHRTHVFAWYNLGAAASGAAGALIPAAVLTSTRGRLAPGEVDRMILFGYALCGLILAALAVTLGPEIEPLRHARPAGSAGAPPRHSWLRLHRSRKVVAKLAALQGIDALAGGLVVQSLTAYWFHLRFGVDATVIGPIFFGTNLLNAVSYLVAARVANRIGLLNTMVFTHIPSNVLLALVPVMPNLPLAVGMLLARSALSQMDVAPRQVYTMTVVAEDEREAAAGVTTGTRMAAAAVAPSITGIAFQSAATGAPFVLAGALKIVYDLLMFGLFRRLPIEEGRRQTDRLTAP